MRVIKFLFKNYLHLIGCFALGIALSANAENRFASQFTEFTLPAKWACSLEGAEWVCQNQDEEKRKEAIIVLAAKLKGPQDSLEQYKAYLETPKQYESIQKKPVTSEPKFTTSIDANGHPWIDSLHGDSEIPGYFTRYLATVKEDIGVLITFSVTKDKYDAYLSDIENLLKTLKVFRKLGGINAKSGSLFGGSTIPNMVSDGSVFPGMQGGGDENSGQTKRVKIKRGMWSDLLSNFGIDLDDETAMYIILGALALFGFMYMKKRR